MIRTEGLVVDIDGARILDGVTVALDQPRIAVIGANGSGKSTFARTLKCDDPNWKLSDTDEA